MTNLIFKKAILVSLLGHLTFFSIFTLSAGGRLAPANYPAISFWGGFLKSYDFIGHERSRTVKMKPAKSPPPPAQLKLSKELPQDYYFKPLANLTFASAKSIFTGKPAVLPLRRKRESVVFLHPVLPYHFNLYFKDRDKVYLELAFNLVSRGATNSIFIKRKISSGNLEVDLLSMHYISHYLFIQQARFTPNNWQTVKIEFSAKQ